jgi:hypothetical protein
MRNRERWLNDMMVELNERVFKQAGYKLNLKKIKISCGFPVGRATAKNKTIGQCFNDAVNGYNEIFIHPCQETSVEVGAVLVHELVHAYDNCQNGHNHVFRKIALAVGLQGKMTATTHTEELKEVIETIVKDIGEYPHKKLDYTPRKKQSTRLIKIHCDIEHPEYIARVSRKTLEMGLPTCPCGHRMEVAE